MIVRQTGSEKNRCACSQTVRQIVKQSDRLKKERSCIQADRQVGKVWHKERLVGMACMQARRQEGRQEGRRTGRQTDRQAGKFGKGASLAIYAQSLNHCHIHIES